MKFARFELLFLIWIVPLLVLTYLYGWRRRRSILNAYAHRRTLSQIVPHGINSRRKWVAVLVIFAAVASVLALSGPQYGYQWQEIERQGIDIVIALDCSRSMLATDIQPTRLDRAKREIYDLLTMLQGDRVGLVAFSGTAFLQCPLTIDYTAFYLFLDVLSPDYLPVGGSDLAAALQSAQAAFDPQSKADKAIILITDGEQTGDGQPLKAAEAAHKAGIKLFTIGVGSTDGVPVPESQGGFKKNVGGQIVLSRLDESLLTRMALTTGGSYVRSVAGDMDLETIYEAQIRSNLDAATLESGRKRIWADRYQWPLGLAIILLLLARWLPAVKQTMAFALICTWISVCPALTWAGPLQDGYESYGQGAYDKALTQFIDGQLQDPENPSVQYNIGNTHYKMDNFQAAKEHYLQALAMAPPELKPSLLYNLGNSAYRLGALDEAIQYYEEALKLNPDDLQASENLAFVKQRLKEQQQNRQDQSGNQPDDKKGQEQPRQQNDLQKEGTGQPPEARAESKTDQQPKQGQQQEDPPAQVQNAQTPKAGDDDQKTDQKAVSQMLNRLKDQPGRAMMPDYRKRSVEKDW